MANLRKEYFSYSKKNGMVRKTIILLRNKSFDECVEYAKKYHNVCLTQDKPFSTISGLLSSGVIKITGK